MNPQATARQSHFAFRSIRAVGGCCAWAVLAATLLPLPWTARVQADEPAAAEAADQTPAPQAAEPDVGPEANPAGDTPAPASTPAPAPSARNVEQTVTEAQRLLAEADTFAEPAADPLYGKLTHKLELAAAALGQMSTTVQDAELVLKLRDLELRAYHSLTALAHRAAAVREVPARLSQWRHAANVARTSGVPGTEVVGDFWLLQADLFDLNHSSLDPARLHRQVIDRLEQFMQESPSMRDLGDTGLGRALLGEVRIALLRLYDQYGMSEQVASLVRYLRDAAGEDSALQTYLDHWFGYTSVIGRTFDARLTTTAGAAWSSADQRGKVLVLHFDDAASAATTNAIAQLHALREELSGSVALLSVDLSAAQAASDQDATATATATATLPALPWPVYREGPDQVQLSSMFAIEVLPRFVLIDAQGQVRAVGSSAAILQRARDLATPDAPAPATATADDQSPKP